MTVPPVFKERSSGQEGPPDLAQVIILVIVLGIAFFTFMAPGMTIMAIVNTVFGLSLGYTQMWTFAVVLCIGILAGLASLNEGLAEGLTAYVIFSVSIIAVFLISHYGFQAKFPSVFLGYFLD